MKRVLVLGLILAASIACNPSIVLEAQTLPASVHAAWTPNPASDNVIGYVVSLDGGTPQAVSLSACSATACVAAVAVPTAGNHSVSVAAQNLSLSADPSSVQTGASASVSFTLNLVPAKVSGATVGK